MRLLVLLLCSLLALAPSAIAERHVCCMDNECAILTEVECGQVCGRWHPDYDSCDPNPCPTIGACCVSEECYMLSEQECHDTGYGDFLGEGIECEPCNPCHYCAHVCCVGVNCYSVYSEGDCESLGGTFHCALHECDPSPCGYEGACCVCDECIVVCHAAECADYGGEYHPEWDSCDPNHCLLQGVDEEPGDPGAVDRSSWGRLKTLYRE